MDIFKKKSKCIPLLFCFVLWLAFVASPQLAFANDSQEESSQGIATKQTTAVLASNEANVTKEVNSSSHSVAATTAAVEASKANNENSAKKESSVTKTDASQANSSSQNSAAGGGLPSKLKR